MPPISALKLLAILAICLTTATPALAHGGGCRKTSPPGQCCHMQKSTGKVHCHTSD